MAGEDAQQFQNSGPPRTAAGDAEHKEKEKEEKKKKEEEDKKFLMQMRGWLMTVGTLFVNMAFQAALQPPDWLHTTDFLRLSQSEIDQWKHPFHRASHAAAAAAAAAPARFAPSPSPSPQAAESATAGLSDRAMAYMYCNYIMFGASLALVLMLPWNIPPHQAKLILRAAPGVLVISSLCAVGTVVLGTAEDQAFTMLAIVAICLGVSVIYPQILRICIATFRAWQTADSQTGKRPPPSPDGAERTPDP